MEASHKNPESGKQRKIPFCRYKQSAVMFHVVRWGNGLWISSLRALFNVLAKSNIGFHLSVSGHFFLFHFIWKPIFRDQYSIMSSTSEGKINTQIHCYKDYVSWTSWRLFSLGLVKKPLSIFNLYQLLALLQCMVLITSIFSLSMVPSGN